MSCPTCNQNEPVQSVPCVECNPIVCPTPNPCAEVTPASCVLYTGADKMCLDEIIYEQGDSIETILSKITDVLCAETHMPEDKIVGLVPIYSEGDNITTSLENVVDYFNNLFSNLPSASGATIVDITHAQLLALKTAGTLQKGEYYRITDFATMYDLPDYTSANNPVLIPVLKTEVVSPIIVFAISSTQLQTEAIDSAYPKDIIHYELEYTTAVGANPTLGRITYRKDEFGNETDYDHRRVKFKRYKDGANKYSSYFDLGLGSQFFLTFNYANYTVRDNYIGNERQSSSVLFDLPNIVFAKAVNNVKFTADSQNGTFLENTTNANFLNEFSGNLFHGVCNNVTFLGLVRNNIIDAMVNVKGLAFDDNIAVTTFKNVDMDVDVISVDFTTATHVYGNYNKKFFKNNAGVLRLSFYDSVDSEQIANITD